MSVKAVSAATTLLVALGGAAQLEAQHPQPPYADRTDRAIKALAPEEVEGLLAGRGLGFAQPAELNGWPGPKHVLELAAHLGIDEATRARIETIRAAMEAEAKAAGAELVEAERALDLAFAKGSAGGSFEAEVGALVARAAELRGQVRMAHLRAHLATRPLLTAEQIARYEAMRSGSGHHHAAAQHGGGHQ